MPPPYDSGISIGGQSLVDGVWRLFGPSLEKLTNPLPLTLPGFTNVKMRLTSLTPIFPLSMPQTTPMLEVSATVEVTGEAALTVVGGLAATVVPAAVSLTPDEPLRVQAWLKLRATGFDQNTHYSVVFGVDDADVTVTPPDPMIHATSVKNGLDAALLKTATQVGLTYSAQPQIGQTEVENVLVDFPGVVGSALRAAFKTLVGETGRLLFPAAGGGASCDVRALPRLGEVNLLALPNHSIALQLGFSRGGAGGLNALPQPSTSSLDDTKVTVSNQFLLELLCCLVQRLPAFTLPAAPYPSQQDVRQKWHNVGCCNFGDVTVEMGPFTLSGGLSVCMDTLSIFPEKRITLVGSFGQTILAWYGWTVQCFDIKVEFELPLAFDFDGAASLANLRVSGLPWVKADFYILRTLVLLIGAVAIAAGLVIFGGAIGAVAVLLVIVAVAVVESLLRHAARTVLRAASLLRSPVAIPPGVFEAFGEMVATKVSIDDLTAEGVLKTPTSAWGLLPRVGFASKFPFPG